MTISELFVFFLIYMIVLVYGVFLGRLWERTHLNENKTETIAQAEKDNEAKK